MIAIGATVTICIVKDKKDAEQRRETEQRRASSYKAAPDTERAVTDAAANQPTERSKPTQIIEAEPAKNIERKPSTKAVEREASMKAVNNQIEVENNRNGDIEVAAKPIQVEEVKPQVKDTAPAANQATQQRPITLDNILTAKMVTGLKQRIQIAR